MAIWIWNAPRPSNSARASRRSSAGALVTLALSFNNDGPFGGFYRYIGAEGTFKAFRDRLSDARDQEIALSGGAFADQDRAFIAAIRDRRVPEASAASCLPAMVLLDRIERSLRPPAA